MKYIPLIVMIMLAIIFFWMARMSIQDINARISMIEGRAGALEKRFTTFIPASYQRHCNWCHFPKSQGNRTNEY
jgi:hypothetical protein